MCRAPLRFSSAIFHAARTLSGSLRSPPSPRGEGFIRRYSFSSYVCIRSDVMGKAVFSYRSLPHWGRGTAPAVDRVLSLTAHLRRIFHLLHLSFIPPVPYPPLRGTFPSRGRLTIRGKPAVKRPSGIVHLYSAVLRSFDSVLPFQISHFLTYDVFLRSG